MVQTWTDRKITTHNGQEYAEHLRTLLSEIVFITGGRLYNEKTHLGLYQMQVQVISKFLLSSFPFFSFSEISNAFYLNSAGKFDKTYLHYGQELNITFIGQVLSAYRDYKQGIFDVYSHELIPVLHPQKEISAPEYVFTDEDHKNDIRKSIEEAYQRLVKDLDMNEELWPEYFYDMLEQDGLIPQGEHEKRSKDAKQKIAHGKQVEIMHKNVKNAKSTRGKSEEKEAVRIEDTRGVDKELEKMRALVKLGKTDIYRPIVTVSKQMIVKDFFLSRFEKGFNNVYVKA